MLTLALDTSTRTGSMAALRDQTILGSVTNTSDQPYSITFFRDLEKLLAQVHLSIQRFDLFAVGVGPGSFTGLRVGLTAVKAWGETFSKPIAAVSCLEAMASKIRDVQAVPDGTLLAPVLDAGRGQVYGCIYRWNAVSARLHSLTDEVVLTAGELITLIENSVLAASVPLDTDVNTQLILISSTRELIRPALENSVFASAQIVEVASVLAGDIGRLGYAKALCGELVDALALDANYVLRPDAERKWKGK
jgi:tRNA threonylcarbamoyladenosine biosynthesis protein TsaB